MWLNIGLTVAEENKNAHQFLQKKYVSKKEENKPIGN
jgi:hypothetical protein